MCKIAKQALIILFSFAIAIMSYAQANTLSIVKSHCKCSPVADKLFIDANKIFYLSEMPDNNSGFDEKMNLVVLEKIGGSWIELSRLKIDPEFDLSRLASDSISNFNISGTQYAYFVIMNAYYGTAFHGTEIHSFYFYNINSDELIYIQYKHIFGQAFGEYSFKDNKTIKDYKQFIPLISKFIEKQYGIQNVDIDDPANFNLKWLSLNENIYSKVEGKINTGTYVDLKFPKYDKDFFYKRLIDDPNNPKIFESDKYSVFAGFVSPILLFSKSANSSYVLWVPNGWPTGGEWGLRSFNIEKITNDLIVASNDFITLEILFETGKIRSYDKN